MGPLIVVSAFLFEMVSARIVSLSVTLFSQCDSEKDGELADQSQYDPSKAHYHPIDDACWKKRQR